jgi:hypothetical protein
MPQRFRGWLHCFHRNVFEQMVAWRRFNRQSPLLTGSFEIAGCE